MLGVNACIVAGRARPLARAVVANARSAHTPARVIFVVGVSAQSSVSGDGGIPELPFPDLPTPDYTEEEKLPPRPAAPPAPEPDNPLPELPPNHPKEVMHSGMRS